MKKSILKILLCAVGLGATPISGMAQDNNEKQAAQQLFYKSQWTNGYITYDYEAPGDDSVLPSDYVNPEKNDPTKNLFVGSSQLDTGYFFCVQKNDLGIAVVDLGWENCESSIPVGNQMFFFEKEKTVIFINPQGDVSDVYIPQNDNYNGGQQAQDLREFYLAGKYVGQKGKRYTFSANKNLATGLSNGVYEFAENEAGGGLLPTIVFKNIAYNITSTRDKLELTPVKMDDEGIAYEEIPGAKKLTLKREIGKEDLKYPLTAKKMLTHLQLNYYCGEDPDNLLEMANEILARNGLPFDNAKLKDYYSKKSWYHPLPSSSDLKLSLIDQVNFYHICHILKKLYPEATNKE